MPVRWSIVENEAKIQSRIKELEEENKKLNKQIEQFKKWVKAWTNIIERLEEENKKLKSELELKNLALKQVQEWSILI